MDQEAPAAGCMSSFRGALRASAVPALVSIRLNQMWFPVETERLSASMLFPYTTLFRSTEAEAVSDPSLVVVTLAVLSTGEEPAVAAVVGEERSEERRVGKECREGRQLRVSKAMAQVV